MGKRDPSPGLYSLIGTKQLTIKQLKQLKRTINVLIFKITVLDASLNFKLGQRVKGKDCFILS